MKIGILGGSFNPPHEGHLHISNLAIKKLRLHQLWWIPTKQNPLKSRNNYLSFNERIMACQKITQDNINGDKKNIYVKNIDNFYSIDLVNLLQKKYKNHQFVWIMGDDNLKNFHHWHNFKKLIHKIEFAIFSREKFSIKARNSLALKIYKKHFKKSQKLPKISIFSNAKLNISSTQIRNEK